MLYCIQITVFSKTNDSRCSVSSEFVFPCHYSGFCFSELVILSTRMSRFPALLQLFLSKTASSEFCCYPSFFTCTKLQKTRFCIVRLFRIPTVIIVFSLLRLILCVRGFFHIYYMLCGFWCIGPLFTIKQSKFTWNIRNLFSVDIKPIIRAILHA